MKWLTAALLILGVLVPTAVTQDVIPAVVAPDEPETAWKLFPSWFEMVKHAERDYKKKKGRYGDMAALRKAHLLATSGKVPPMDMVFEVTTSEGGRHFQASIGDVFMTMSANDLGAAWSRREPRDFADSPGGPVISVAR